MGLPSAATSPGSEQTVDGKNKTQLTETTNRTTQTTAKKHKRVNERRVMEKCYECHVKILNFHCDPSNRLKDNQIMRSYNVKIIFQHCSEQDASIFDNVVS